MEAASRCEESIMGLDGNEENAFYESNDISMDEDHTDMRMVPCEGMEFSSMEEAYGFYNAYAKVRGFGIRKNNSVKSSGVICKKVFVCEKEGSKRTNDRRQAGKEVKRHADSREQCKAHMVIKTNEKVKWVVVHFHDMHSHALATPSKVGMIRSHKKLTSTSRELISAFHECGVGPSRIARVLKITGGSVDNMCISSQDCRNHLGKARKNNVGQQCMRVVEYFQRKHAVEDGFFSAMEVDENNQLRSLFWADYRSRWAYIQFGDVIVFDVTYRTNSFNMPFAPIVGVNHHRQSTLFGCALLADETEETFTWVFKTFLKCMWDKMPQGIITDQDVAMRKAIATVFPGCVHRFCSWHIGRNALIHLNQLKFKYMEFNDDYDKLVYSDNTNECEVQWATLKEKYEIPDDSWLQTMYNDRHHWIQAYLKDYFFAGMTSSQRSESINSFFNGFVSGQTPLSEFVLQYDNAVASRREDEASEDHKSMHTNPTLFLGHGLEKQASKFYTRNLFSLFQEQFKQGLTYMCSRLQCEGETFIYKVNKDVDGRSQIVTFQNQPEICGKCSCKMFESKGILCRHILRVFFQNNVQELSDKYILFRWRIAAKYSTSTTMNDNDSSSSRSTVTPYMVYCMRNMLYKIGDLGLTSLDLWNLAMPTLEMLFHKLANEGASSASQMEDTVLGQSEASANQKPYMPTITVRDPSKIKTKGRPKKIWRIKAGIEQNIPSQSKKRKCGNCQQIGHYTSTCPQNKGGIQMDHGEQSQMDPVEQSVEEMLFQGENLSQF